MVKNFFNRLSLELVMSKITEQDALNFHSEGKPGKFEIHPTKPLTTQRDLSLAYSPGVAHPCLEIEKDPQASYKYTNRGNMVAVITNGTAVLGLGSIGALASKPVMEGKAVLFKKFADVDSIDLELDTTDIDTFVNAVKIMGPSFGGINLEDIKAPECFIIEQRLRDAMDIPVFHDDQHGTAIVAAAGLINSTHISGKKLKDIKLVVNGAGAASLACVALIKSMGVSDENIIICDSKGVIYLGRTEGMNEWKSIHAVDTPKRTLAEVMVGADAFFGLSVSGALTKDMVKSMAKDPIIFAMANPDPEITPDEAHSVRDDAIVATGRSDYPNQVNNVLGFPFIFRGALDVRATAINDEMKIAAANAIADLAREEIPEEIASAHNMQNIKFGKGYIIPMPFDYRLMSTVPPAVAKAAMDSGVALKPLDSIKDYEISLKARIDPTASAMQGIFNLVKNNPKRVIFAEGDSERVLRAASAYKDAGYGDAIVVGDTDIIRKKIEDMNLDESLEILDPATSENITKYTETLYNQKWREGYMKRDISSLLKNDRNVFAFASMIDAKADATITSISKTYSKNFDNVNTFVPTIKNREPMGVMMIMAKGKTYFIADAVSHANPDSYQLANIAQMTAGFARRMGHVPRVAFISFSNFGEPECGTHKRLSAAVKELDNRGVNFEYDGEMVATVALDYELQKRVFPHTNLSGPANVLVMPGLSSAHIASRLIQELGEGTIIGPLLLGFDYPVQIPQMNSTSNDIVNLAALTAYDAVARDIKKQEKQEKQEKQTK